MINFAWIFLLIAICDGSNDFSGVLRNDPMVRHFEKVGADRSDAKENIIADAAR